MKESSFNFMQEVFGTVLSYSLDLFAYLDANRKYQYISQSYADFYGLNARDLIGCSPEQVFDTSTFEEIVKPNVDKCISSGKPVHFKSWIQAKNSINLSYLYISYLPHISSETNEVAGIIVIAKDVTEFKRAEGLLSRSANTDALTNIPNRLFLDKKLQALCFNEDKGPDEQPPFGLLFCDLDGFKQVNDKHGHAVGDKVLNLVAARLKQQIRNNDIIARYGGDEFVILIQLKSEEDDVIERVKQKITDAITQPFSLSGNTISIGVSIGIARYPLDGMDPESLLSIADREMYNSKNSIR